MMMIHTVSVIGQMFHPVKCATSHCSSRGRLRAAKSLKQNPDGFLLVLKFSLAKSIITSRRIYLFIFSSSRTHERWKLDNNRSKSLQVPRQFNHRSCESCDEFSIVWRRCIRTWTSFGAGEVCKWDVLIFFLLYYLMLLIKFVMKYRFEHILDEDFEEPGNLSIGNISTSISAFELAEGKISTAEIIMV